MKIKVKKRHGLWNKIAGPIIERKLLNKKFNYTAEKCDIKPPFLVVGNHTTDYDAFCVSESFENPLYFVMSDHVSSKPFVGKLIEHLVCPIPITKSTHDVSTVRGIMSVIEQGASVGLFPEGNKSFAGEMSEMKPALSKLVKKLNVPLLIYNIEGGYFTAPRWALTKRLGEVHGRVKSVIMPDEIQKLTHEELFEKIKSELRVNAYEVQEKKKIAYEGENLAENIETLLYLCPKCKSLSTLHGKGDHVYCDSCDFDATYDEYGYLHNAPFDRLDKLDEFQKSELKKIDFTKFDDNTVITSDENFLVMQKVDKFKNKKLGMYRLELYKNSFELVGKKDVISIPLDQINGYGIEAVNGIQLSLRDGRVYRMKNNGPVSGLKYVNLYCVLTNKKMNF